MKIYKSRIPIIAADVARALIDAEAVEVAEEQKSLFIQDIADVLTSYIETERKIHEEAQDLIANRNVDFSSLGRFKRELAKKCNFGLGDDAIDGLTDHIIDLLYHPENVDEIWADNPQIRKISREVLYRHTQIDDDLDAEVRAKIKNLSEGSVAWDVRYQQVLAELRRRKGL